MDWGINLESPAPYVVAGTPVYIYPEVINMKIKDISIIGSHLCINSICPGPTNLEYFEAEYCYWASRLVDLTHWIVEVRLRMDGQSDSRIKNKMFQKLKENEV